MTVKTTPAVVRVSARDRRIVTFTLDNALDEPVSGSLQFDLPAGLAAVPEKAHIRTGPAQGISNTSSCLIVSKQPRTAYGALSHLLPGWGQGKEVRTAALPLTVMTGPTMQHVYEYPRPYYSIHSPGYTVRRGHVQWPAPIFSR